MSPCEGDADAARLGAVAARPPGATTRGEVDLARVTENDALVEPREVEEVADEPLEPLRLLHDDAGGLRHGHHAVEERLAVAADRGERRLQLVADREQEGRSASRARSRSSASWLNDAARFATSVEPVTGAGPGRSPAASARLASRDALDRAGDGPGEQERDDGGDARADGGGDRRTPS